MTSRTCPWCGGKNLHIKNCMATDSMCPSGAIHWEDKECGYTEVTTHSERYDYKLEKYVPQEMKVLRFHKPTPPLPENQRPEYLRSNPTKNKNAYVARNENVQAEIRTFNKQPEEAENND